LDLNVPVDCLVIALVGFAGIGALSGYLGIGGGFLLIPLLTWTGRCAGLDPEAAIKQAFGTALFISSLTALSGYLIHRKKTEDPPATRVPLAVAVGAGAFLGASTSARLEGAFLYSLFAIVLVLSAGLMLLRARRERTGSLPRPAVAVAVGVPLGYGAALVGLGGAVFTGIVFGAFLGYPIRRVAAATSLAQFVGGTCGWLGFVLASPTHVNFLLGAIALVVTLPAARLGARITHATPPLWIRLAYSALLVGLGVKMWVGG
jgi:uncharacterized membrane protein YfcA